MWFLLGKFHYINKSRTKDELALVILGLDISTCLDVSKVSGERKSSITRIVGECNFCHQELFSCTFLTTAHSPGKFENGVN